MSANHKKTEFLFNGKKQVLERGQIICGRHQIGIETGINESKIYRTMAIFEKEQLIEQQKTNLFTLVSIVNYKSYQQNEQQTEQPVNNQRTTSEQPVNTSKELIRTKKNDKKESKEKHLECVLLTKKEHSKLIEKFGSENTDEKILELNDAVMSKGYKYSSHYHTILTWDRKNGSKSEQSRYKKFTG